MSTLQICNNPIPKYLLFLVPTMFHWNTWRFPFSPAPYCYALYTLYVSIPVGNHIEKG